MRDQIIIIGEKKGRIAAIEAALRSVGYDVTVVERCEGLRSMMADSRPLLFITQFQLMDGDARDLCKELSCMESTRAIPVLVLASVEEAAQLEDTLAVGAAGFLLETISEGELLAHVRAMARMSRRFRELDAEHRMREEMCQMLAHDLSGNLCVLQMTNGCLRRYVTEGHLAPVLEQTEVIVREMSTLLRELLVGAKASGDRFYPKLDRHSLVPIVIQSVEKHRYPAASRDVVIRMMFEESDVFEIHGDCRLLGRMVDNLLANAISHSPEGGSVRVTLREEGGVVSLLISDEGAGVPDEHKELIFRKFISLQDEDDGGRPMRTGVGLGLAFCRLVAEMHGGNIEVRDNEDGGACFVTRIKRAAHSRRN